MLYVGVKTLYHQDILTFHELGITVKISVQSDLPPSYLLFPHK